MDKLLQMGARYMLAYGDNTILILYVLETMNWFIWFVVNFNVCAFQIWLQYGLFLGCVSSVLSGCSVKPSSSYLGNKWQIGLLQ
jgi:hypothetical protein